MKKIFKTVILVSIFCMFIWCAYVLANAQTLEETVNYAANDNFNRINDDNDCVQTKTDLKNDLMAKVNALDSEIQACQNDLSQRQSKDYGALTPSAMQADDNIKGIVNQIGMDVQGTVKPIR